MQDTVKTAGETAKKVTLVIMKDCRTSHNETVTVFPEKENLYRRLAAKRGWLVGVRKGGLQ